MPEIVVFAAHPDDETIGLGAQLARFAGVQIVHVTDGAPRDMRDAAAHGFLAREDYALARRRELLEALALAGIGEDQTCCLGMADQEASYDLVRITCRVLSLLQDCRPGLVFTPPYEGGHPDHDATAFAVHAARRLAAHPPLMREYTLYHGSAGAIVTGEFLACEDRDITTLELSQDDRALKRRMIACFRTQCETLRPFGIERERSRSAPAYDFTQPPRADCVYYDMFSWGIQSGAWRTNARDALKALELSGAF
jgi:LmbE family N-acetylglucosaminyl deacetylase